ncbi:protein BZR1 homolog 2 [Oryza glaberrima]|nr:protein BZR1 homolog 2 [Oryza glaberrima]
MATGGGGGGGGMGGGGVGGGAGAAGVGVGGRMPTWRERENNKRRERRRRAIAAKIFAGLRAHGGYKLPKHCDNNEVLKALCNEAGWVVEPDGTTYRKGYKPPERMEVIGCSVSPSPCSSYQPSPRASYNASPTSSSFPSGASSPFLPHPNNMANGVDGNPILPWLKTLSNSPSSKKHPQLPPLLIHGGSISAPVTPPLSSPTARTPRMKTDWDESNVQPTWTGSNSPCVVNSTPPSPGRTMLPDPAWLAGIQISSTSPSSPTFSLVSSNPFSVFKDAIPVGNNSSRMCTPGQSGTCSPAIPGMAPHPDIHMMDAVSDEFAFGSSTNGGHQAAGLVRAWEGERIHEDSGSDDLELTLGSSRTRAAA